MDLNTLISTIVTSTAALVAIIGGFLVSRVISISSEQNGIKRKIREIDNDLIAKKEIKANIEKYLFEDDLNDFMSKKNIKRLVLYSKSLEEIIEEDEFTYLTKEELQPHFDQLRSIAKELFAKIEELDEDEISNSFNEIKEQVGGFKYPEREKWYKRVFEVLNDEATKSQQTGILSQVYNYDIPISTIAPNSDYKDKKKELGQIEDEIKIIELQKKAQVELLSNYGKPVWIWSGIGVLFYASLVGIIYPSTLLPYPLETYNDGLTKWFLLSLFYSQLLALFVYLSFAMYKLTHSDEDMKW